MGPLLRRSPSVLLSNAVLAAGAAFALVLLAVVVQRRQWLLAGGAETAFFLGLPLAALAGFVLAFRLSPANRAAAAAVALAAGASLYLTEAYLTFVRDPAPPPGAALADSRTKYQVVQDMRRQGTRAYPAVFPAYLMQTGLDGRLRSPLAVDGNEVLPLGGVAGAPTVLCNETGAYVTYASDEAGFNNPPGLWNADVALDAAAVGDSFVNGYCVAPDRNFVALLRRALPGTLNLGTSGAGPLVMLAGVKEFLPARRPKAVLWFFFEGNDVPGDLAIERKSPLLMRYLEPGFRQGLDERRAAVDSSLARHVDGLLEAGTARRETDAGGLQTAISLIGLKNVRAALGLPSTSEVPDYDLFRRVLAEAKRSVDSWAGSLVFVYLPTFASATGAGGPAFDDLHRNVLGIAAELGVATLDMRQVFARHPDPASLFPFRRRGHYNEAGHALVAETVLAALAAAKGGPRR